MPINVNEVYQAVDFQVSKELGSGYLQPDAFNSFANRCVNELFNKYADIFQERSQITDKLIPFIRKEIVSIDDDGKMFYADLPAAYIYVDGIAIRAFDPEALALASETCDDDNPINYKKLPQIDVEVIDNAQLGNRLTSKVIPPSEKYPIATYYDTFIQFAPIDLGTAIFEYLRQPQTVIWAFTLDSDGLEVYNPINSVDFEFNWKMTNEIIIKICSYFSVSVREEDLYQYTNQMEAKQA